MSTEAHARLRLLVAATAAIAGLVLLRGQASDAARNLCHLGRWLDAAGSDRVLAALGSGGLWLLCGWLAVGLTAAVLGTVPGGLGRLARRASGLVLPAAIPRLIAGAAGLGVLLGPVAAGATPLTPQPAVPVISSQGTSQHGASQHGASQHGARQAGVGRHRTAATPAQTSGPLAPGRPTPARSGAVEPTGSAGSAGLVRVRPGDSLWSLASRTLPAGAGDARVAATWPRWYAANRDRIGNDPDLIHPGQQLRPPPVTRPAAPIREDHPA